MSEKKSVSDQWADYRPTKTIWFWSLAGASVATMILGFAAGGWTTGGTAANMATVAARDARAQLASVVCVHKFTSAADASANLAELKETSSYQQDNFITDGGWAMLVGMENAVPGAADLCADELVAMENLPPRSVDLTTPTTDG
jgi:hypothetical protein